MRAVENQGLADDLDHLNPGQPLGHGCGGRFLLQGGCVQNLHLQELPVVEGLVHRLQECGARPVRAELEDGLQVVGQRAEVSSLLRVQLCDGMPSLTFVWAFWGLSRQIVKFRYEAKLTQSR